MIYTLTLNPSLDYYLYADNFKEGELNRINKSLIAPGGKGINVSLMLKFQGYESVPLGFLGGFSGYELNRLLKEKNISGDFINIGGTTRINVKLKNNTGLSNPLETEINAAGPTITDRELDSFYAKISSLKSGDTLVLSGSVPDNLPMDIYGKILELLPENVSVIGDTSGSRLKYLLCPKTFLLKPNNIELGDYFNVAVNSYEDAVFYGKELLNTGVGNILVSMGGKGAVLICKAGSYICPAGKGTIKNTVGAGDSLVAGFIVGTDKYRDYGKALEYAVNLASEYAYGNIVLYP